MGIFDDFNLGMLQEIQVQRFLSAEIRKDVKDVKAFTLIVSFH